jgi:hypothetical protein
MDLIVAREWPYSINILLRHILSYGLMVDMTENTAQAEPTDKTDKILVNVVLDRSGSMGSVRQSTIDGYNEYLNGLRKDTESEYSLTLIQFDLVAAKADLTISYVDKPLAEVHDLTPADYEPRGSTPLYDAIGECIRRVEAKGRGVITLIVTDGHENASTEFTRDSVKALIADKEKAGWSFTFLGANIDSFAASGAIGLSAMTTSNYAPGNEAAAFKSFAGMTQRYAGATRSVGMHAASARSSFTTAERSAMGGPQRPTPPVAPPFRRQPPIPTGRTPVARKDDTRKPRTWKESTTA